VKGVISAGHEVTAQAGADILRAGGNAFDAVLGAMFASTAAEPILSSVGGGGFLMAQPADGAKGGGAPILYDFFVDTPRVKHAVDDLDFHAIHADFGPATQEFHIGVGAAAMPGIVPGAYAIHGDLCTMTMADLLAPAISAARIGVTVNSFHAYLHTIIEPILRASPEVEALYAPGGSLLKAGDFYRNGALAETFETLARSGEALFGSGDVGLAILKQSEMRGGHLSRADLDKYTVIKREPLILSQAGVEIALNPAPAQSGALIAYGLGVLFEIKEQKGDELSMSDLIVAMELTNEARANLGANLVHCLDQEIIARHLAGSRGHPSQSRGTTHISVIDGEGNTAALTLSNGEGCGHMVGVHGFMLNNMLGEEDLNPGGFHQWSPGTRLSTMMAPTIMSNHRGRHVALGSGGSNRIRTAILQVLYNLLYHGAPLDRAVEYPRIHLERDGVLSFEDLFDGRIRDELLEAHSNAKAWPTRNMFFGGVNAVGRSDDGKLFGAGDQRRLGTSIVVE